MIDLCFYIWANLNYVNVSLFRFYISLYMVKETETQFEM
jgi:hypothetical protein